MENSDIFSVYLPVKLIPQETRIWFQHFEMEYFYYVLKNYILYELESDKNIFICQ